MQARWNEILGKERASFLKKRLGIEGLTLADIETPDGGITRRIVTKSFSWKHKTLFSWRDIAIGQYSQELDICVVKGAPEFLEAVQCVFQEYDAKYRTNTTVRQTNYSKGF